MHKPEHPQPKRFEHIDLMEVIAIFFVLAYHATNYEFNFLSGGGWNYFRYLYRALLSTCVPLFFLANGFLLLNREFVLKKHIIRSIRLVLLTFLWALIDYLMFALIDGEPITVKELIFSVWNLGYGSITHMWYMGALVCIYVLFPLIKVAYDHNRKIFYYFIMITAILTFGNSILNRLGSMAAYFRLNYDGILSENWFNIFNPFREIFGYAFVYFCVGGCLMDWLERIEANRKKYNIAGMAVLVLATGLQFVLGVILSHISGRVWDVVWYGYDTVFTFANVLAIFVLTTNYRGKNDGVRKVVTTTARNTFGIFHIHVIYVYWLKPYAQEIALISNVPGNLLFAAVVLLLSLGTALLIKRIPVLRRIL